MEKGDRQDPGLITSSGSSFHNSCNEFFNLVDQKTLESYLTALTDQSDSIIKYFQKVLDGGPDTKMLLDRFARFQYGRMLNFWNGPHEWPNVSRWFPCNREVEIIRPSRGLWGTIDSVEYLNNDDTEDRIVVELKSGSLNKWRLPKLRRELAVYKLLLDETKLAPKPVEYIGAFCAGNEHFGDGMFFEKLKSQTITALFKTIKAIRETFEKAYIGPFLYNMDYFPKSADAFCMLCSYSEKCYGGLN